LDRFHLLTVFVAVAEEEGFAAAARRLEMSAPAVTRAVAALEEHLGVRLLNRTTRHVRATEAGLRYLEDARRILTAMDSADAAVRGITATPRGELSITAPVLFGGRFVTPVVVDYLQRYPETRVSALFLDRVVNLMEEGIDIGIRIGELPDSSMRALRVGEIQHLVCASPDYLAAHGTPQQPIELQQHCIINSRAGDFSTDWHFQAPEGGDSSVRLKPRLTVTSNDASIAATCQGLGISRILSYQVAEQLQDGRLVRLLADYEQKPLPVHILHREGRFTNAKVRAFVDLLAAALRAEPILNPS